jgi:hypothetical protein
VARGNAPAIENQRADSEAHYPNPTAAQLDLHRKCKPLHDLLPLTDKHAADRAAD